MRKPKPTNWIKRANRFVPFEFFSANPDDYKKYINNPDCPPPMLAAAWEDVKSKMEDIKSNMASIAADGELGSRCKSIDDTIYSITSNPNTPEDIIFEMTEINWQAFKFRCGNMEWRKTTRELINRNSYENLVKIFENANKKLSSYDEKSKKSNFTAYIHDSIYALNVIRMMMNRMTYSRTDAVTKMFDYSDHYNEKTGTGNAFLEYVKDKQLNIIKNFVDFFERTFMSRDKEIQKELYYIASLGAGEDYSSKAFVSEIWEIMFMLHSRVPGTYDYGYGINYQTTRECTELTKKMASAGMIDNFATISMYRQRLYDVKKSLGMQVVYYSE